MQNARNIHYEDDRALFSSDEKFANFRAVSAGSIAEGALCRSASPCDNQHNRAPYSDTFMGQAGVNTVIDLADNDEKIAGYMQSDDFNSPNFKALYEKGNVVPLALNTAYYSDEFKQKIVSGFTAMADSEGPYLVHCTEGKDRTGFVCMLLEALCGASYEEIVDDYMITYNNYYGITKQSDPERYDVIVHELLDPMIKSVVGEDADIGSADLAAAAEEYLKNAGMSEEKIENLRSKLTEA
ncbi:MAG: tyrosine-protein phosphatase [Firmicutes bacterium]|nr:tyrosine-protein phosphatase [Bacillota bacterium]